MTATGRMRGRRALLAVLATALVAGCGSTVQTSGTATSLDVQGLSGPALGGDLPGAATAGVGPASAPDAESTIGPEDSAARSRAVAPGEGKSAVAGGGRPVGSGELFGPGVTANTVLVGIIYSSNSQAANEAFGVTGTENGDLDVRVYWQYGLDEINKRGGVLGRKLVPVWFNIDSNRDFIGQMQQACAAFTEDNHVFAVFGGYFVNDTLRSCLQNHGAVMLDEGVSVTDDTSLQRFPSFFEVAMLDLTDGSIAKVERLVSRGFFSGTHHIGVVTFDDTMYLRAVAHGVKPALARHGLKVDDVRTVPIAWTTDEVGAESAAISSVVLAFKREHIDRVLFTESTGDIALLFMTSAETQTYRPRYGLDSQDGGALLPQNVPAAQLHGAIGVGWLPVMDVLADQDPNSKASPQRRECLAMFARHGATFSRPAEPLPLAICDLTSFLQRVAARTVGGLTAATFVRAADGLGRSFASTMTFATRFAADKHDGAAAGRDFAFVDSCTCYRWTSGVSRID